MINFKGAKYLETRGLTLKDVAKLIREDIKKAQGTKEIPASIKFSVRKDANSINVRAVSGLDDLNIFNQERLELEMANPHGYISNLESPLYSSEWLKIKEKVDAIMQQYNKDNSDSMVDYFEVKFYGDFEIEWTYREELKNKAKNEME